MKFKQIYLEVTKECNLKCSFCPAKFTAGKYLTTEQAKLIIERTKDYTDTYYLHVLGEPLMYKELDTLLSIMDDYHKQVKITTNGLLLAKSTEVLLKHLSVKQINISVQAWLPFNLEYQRELINDLITFIKKANQKFTITIRFWNDKQNETVQKLNNFVYHSLLMDLEGLDDKINSLTDFSRTIRLKPYLLISCEDEFSWPSLDHLNNLNSNYCLGGKKQLAILNNGDVVLCCLDYLGHTKIGNIFEQDLTTIFCGELYLKFSETLRKHQSYFELCQKCDYRNRFN